MIRFGMDPGIKILVNFADGNNQKQLIFKTAYFLMLFHKTKATNQRMTKQKNSFQIIQKKVEKHRLTA